MSKQIPEKWEIFIEQYPKFLKVQRELARNEWYRNDGWVMFIGSSWNGIYSQVYKAHWHNYTLDGIHFEMGMGADNLASKTMQLDLHIGHRNLFDRERFNSLTIDRMAQVVETWADVSFSKHNLAERLSLTVSFTKTKFPQQIADGFAQLCTQLGPIIDDGLAKL